MTSPALGLQATAERSPRHKLRGRKRGILLGARNTNANSKGRLDTAGGSDQLGTGQAALRDPGGQAVKGASGGLNTTKESGVELRRPELRAHLCCRAAK